VAKFTGGARASAYLEELARRLSTAREVRVGYSSSARYEDGTYMATVAASQNYGAPSKGIPPRPFFSNAIADGKTTWGKLLVMELRRLDYNAAGALEAIGGQMAGDIAASLVKTNSPALSEVTLLLRSRFPDRVGMEFSDVKAARKDVAEGKTSGLTGTAAKPLVWTGKMLQYLQGPQAWEVRQ